MSEPPLYHEYQVLKRLKIRASELFDLQNIGMLAPVARTGGDPMYCAETIDALATDYHSKRMACAIWWDFDLRRPRFLPAHFEWVSPDVPFYPFDNAEQEAWARRYYKLKRACAPGPYPDPARLARRRLKLEAEATKAFERKHGIKRPRKRGNRKLRLGRGVFRRELSRTELRDLVWSKTMIRAAADLGMSEFTLRKICKRYLIPLPTRGHFNHKDPKKRPAKPALPPMKRLR
ncbi:hypothetical protein ACVME8_009666 [Bradyrhizobium diazoefficiens]